MAERQPALVTPFWVRIATETSLSPGWLLIAFPAVLYSAYLALEALFGRGVAAATDFAGDYETRILPTWATSIGYFSMMAVYLARGTLRDLEALRPVLSGGEAEYSSLREQLIRFDRRRLWIGALIMLALYCLNAELAVERWTRLVAGEWSLRAICIVAVTAMCCIVAGWGAVYVIDSSRLYSRIGERHVTVDLLDLGPLSPLTRHGLRVVLFVVVFMAVLAAVWSVGDPWGSGSRAVALLLACLAGSVAATTAFVFPVRGLRRQIRACKAEKLAELRDEIHRDEELIASLAPQSTEASTRLPALLAYKHEIDSVREWPFDAPTLTRFFLYVAIPLGSWVGGALVERLLGAALD